MRIRLAVASLMFSASLLGHATTLASSMGGTKMTTPSYLGESFTVSGTGSYNNITFNFLTGTTNAPFAVGTGYLFSAPYNEGAVCVLSYSNCLAVDGVKMSSFLGKSVATAGLYVFDPTLTLTAGTTYYFYEDGVVPPNTVNGFGSSGTGYYAGNPPSDFAAYQGSLNFAVNGTSTRIVTPPAVTPEPSSFVLLGTGLVGAAATMRRRLRKFTA